MFAGQKILIKGGDLNGPKKRVAVIGCGVGGLVSMKTALEYGHHVTGFERMGDIGGLWNWKTYGTEDGYAEIPDAEIHCYPGYKTLITNTCKYNTAFSDFPPLDSQKNDFMRHEEVFEYATAYANNFKLLPLIKFNANVTGLNKDGNEWHVTYTSGNNVNVDLFDYVMIATGAFGFPHHVDISGKEKYKGLFIHSGQVRNPMSLFNKKRVFVIGGAYSAAEMMNLSLTAGASKLYVSSTGRPGTQSAWAIDRLVKSVYGDMRPWDYAMTRECSGIVNNDYTPMLREWCYPFHKAKPDSTLTYPGDAIAIIDVKLAEKAKQKDVLEYVAPVEGLSENEVILKDGKIIKDIDVVVSATGYDQKFPFLDQIWKREEQIECKLYNYVIQPNPGLDGIGFVLMQPSGFPLLPVAENQARWFMHKIVSRSYQDNIIFSEEERLHMLETLDEKQATMPAFHRFNYITDVPLLNEYLARDIGSQPPDYKQLIATGDYRNIELGVALAYGPYIGMQYRIQGPHSWPRAAEECVAMAKRFLGNHFDDYVQKVKNNIYPRSGVLDPVSGPYNTYN